MFFLNEFSSLTLYIYYTYNLKNDENSFFEFYMLIKKPKFSLNILNIKNDKEIDLQIKKICILNFSQTLCNKKKYIIKSKNPYSFNISQNHKRQINMNKLDIRIHIWWPNCLIPFCAGPCSCREKRKKPRKLDKKKRKARKGSWRNR